MLRPDSIYIELKGDPKRIQQYKEFASAGDIEIVEEGQGYYMTSPQLEVMASDIEAYKYGQELLDTLHGVSTVIYGGPFGISLGTVNRIPGVQCGAGSSSLPFTVTVVRPQSEELVREAKELILAARNVPVILKCLKYYRLGYPSIYDMGKIIEIIEKDCQESHKKLIKRGYIENAILDNLGANFNNPDLHGDQARHAVTKGGPISQKKYMPIEVMQGYVKTIFEKWVADKIDIK